MRNDNWLAISATEDIKYIDDLDLLYQICSAYYYIRRLIFFEDKCFDPHHKMSVISVSDERQTMAGENVQSGIKFLRPQTHAVLDETLSVIEKKLQSYK